MKFKPLPLPGAFLIEQEAIQDQRGFFARTFCQREFAAKGLASSFVQCSASVTQLRGTLRGLHLQRPPCSEVKLIRCTRGAIHDVIVDLRPESASYGRHISVELSPRSGQTLYVPAMFAHGYQTLENDTEVFYQISEYYAPELATGVRHDDPALNIFWPLPVLVISEKDRQWPAFSKFQPL